MRGDFLHVGAPKGYVPAIKIEDGVQVRMDKQFFVHHLLENRSIESQMLMLNFDLAIEKVTDQEVFVRFDSKQ